MALPIINTAAPALTLPDQTGTIQSLNNYVGTWVLVYFYPKDDTPGCTTEACTLRDKYAEYKEHGITILGVSADSVKSHEKFAQKYDLPFTILADEAKEAVNAWGVWGEKSFLGKKFMGIKRTSFLVDPKGKIAKIYENVKPADHAAEVLSDIRALQKS